MKNRKGFVSNSSTSSFIIYGAVIEDGEYDDYYGDDEEDQVNEDGTNPIEWLREIRKRDPELYDNKVNAYMKKLESFGEKGEPLNKYRQEKFDRAKLLLKIDTLTEDESKIIIDAYGSELVYSIGDELFGLSVNHPPWGETYVGLNWCDVGDNETGAQFKERATKLVEMVFGKNDMSTLEHAWRDG